MCGKYRAYSAARAGGCVPTIHFMNSPCSRSGTRQTLAEFRQHLLYRLDVVLLCCCFGLAKQLEQRFHVDCRWGGLLSSLLLPELPRFVCSRYFSDNLRRDFLALS